MKIAKLMQVLTTEERKRIRPILKERGLNEIDPVTVGMAQYVYDAFGVIYDFRIRRFYREIMVRIITEEELNRVIDEYL